MNEAAVEIAVPSAVHDLGLLDQVDYEDAFRVPTTAGRTPEQWLRGFLNDAPRWFVVPWVGAGTALLGARFGSLRSPDHVLGWRILVDRDDVFAIGLDSLGGLSARLFALTPGDVAVVATQVRLSTGYARSLWPAIRPAHRHFAAQLLARTAERSNAALASSR